MRVGNYVYMSAGDPSGAETMGGYEPSDKGAGKQTWVLCKSIIHS